MNYIKVLQRLMICLVAIFSTGMSLAGQRVGDFSLLDHTGKFHQLSYYGDHQAVVLVATDLDSVPTLTQSINQLQNKFGQQQVKVFLLHVAAQTSRELVANSVASAGLRAPVLMDEVQLVTKTLGMQRVGEVMIVDPAAMSVLYRGELSSADAAVTAVLAGAAPTSQEIVSGRQLELVDPDSAISYVNDIVPILQNNCVSCHHDGAIGPWSMSSHAMVKGWSPMMREVVMTKRMPPGQIDNHVGRTFVQVAGLSDEEKRTLIQWIDAGAPKDGDIDPLAQLTFDDPKFTLGEPDMVFKVPAQSIPATGVIDYRYVPVELNLDRDVWIQAMEFVPGDREVLHHVIAYLTSPADKTSASRSSEGDQGQNLAGFAPGRQPDQFADNSGRLIPKGSNLLLQMHYTTSGRETVDETEVGLFIYDEPPEYVMSGGVAGQRRFMIPPGAKEHKLRGEQLIERDAYLYQMTPHMHFRGKYMSYTAEYPDGTSELLLSVPKYDFNWQFSYQLEEPLFMPSGTKLVANGAMDNSDRNPGNPDPTKPVFFGLQTMHEMFFGFTTLRYVGDTTNDSVAVGEEVMVNGGAGGR